MPMSPDPSLHSATDLSHLAGDDAHEVFTAVATAGPVRRGDLVIHRPHGPIWVLTIMAPEWFDRLRQRGVVTPASSDDGASPTMPVSPPPPSLPSARLRPRLHLA